MKQDFIFPVLVTSELSSTFWLGLVNLTNHEIVCRVFSKYPFGQLEVHIHHALVWALENVTLQRYAKGEGQETLSPGDPQPGS